MSRAIVLQHLDREGPGFIADACKARGLALEVCRSDLGTPIPEELDQGDLLVVMGGPMGVGDLGDPRYPFLAPEIDLLRTALAANRPILGICLGAQLLAHAAGARVYPNRKMDASGVAHDAREVGFGEVRLLAPSKEKVLAGLPPSIAVLHWHGDTFDLPAGAVRLAESDLCANQAFRLRQHAFGLQFHVETDAELVRRWAEEDAAYVRSALGPEGPARIAAESEVGVANMRPTSERLIGNILEQLLASR
jgi:GMP synthase (glutamine-hydrolysing)